MDKYLIKYLRDNSISKLSAKYIDFFKIELDWHIYNSERHISESYHRNSKISIKSKIYAIFQYVNALSGRSGAKGENDLKILSTVSFSNQSEISDLGFNLYTPVWNAVGRKKVVGDLKTIRWHKNVQRLIRKKDFYLYLDLELHKKLENFQEHLVSEYTKQDFKALFLFTDQYFYSKYSIDLFKIMKKPSFIFSHGLPALYSSEVENRADYLMVWSERVRQNYINAGFNPSKVKVIGNPKYKKIDAKKELRSDLSDVLIIPVSTANWHQHEYDSKVITDKSMVILYLYKVQSVLKKLGVVKARYRTHPSIDKKWVHAFLDQEFFICDDQSLSDSLERSSLLIGATSTVLLESLIGGVNYIVFEPKDENNINMAGYKLVPPFDGSDEKVMIAHDENELEKMLLFNAKTEYSLVHDYIQDFDASILKDLIN